MVNGNVIAIFISPIAGGKMEEVETAEAIDAFGVTMVQKRKDNSIDLSDGSVNISILPLAANRSRRAGLDHIGFSAEDDDEQIRRMEAAGAIKESTRSPYEEKFKGPEGIIVDVGHWPGAAPGKRG